MIKVQDLVVRYTTPRGQVQAVDGVSFSVEPAEFYTLLGPSGCGKTTTLRSIAGLETPFSGEISVAGTVVFSSEKKINIPVHHRGLGMVFQSYAVWPHMTVFNNVSYPLKYGSNPIRDRKIVRDKAMNALERVQMESMADRNATELSGGQQQRVALARALVNDPKVMLLDEPLSNLDAKLRADMRSEMESLVRSVGTTTLYVTHDQIEALAMSDRVALMSAGHIVQEARPRELYDRPNSRFAAGFVGDMNLIRGKVIDSGGDSDVWVKIADGRTIRSTLSNGSAETGADVEVVIRPENVRIEPAGGSSADENLFDAVMGKSTFVGDQVIAVVEMGGAFWQVRLRPADPIPLPGTPVTIRMPAEFCTAFGVEVSAGTR